MFIGHYAVGFAAKRFAPTVSLGTFFLAAQLLDLIWPNLVLLGIEILRIDPGNTAFTPLEFVSYPWSHSLLTSVVWGALLGALYWLLRKAPRASLLLLAVVVSHWILDFVTHRPDLPLVPFAGAPRYGLGLWNSKPATLLVELALFGFGLFLYMNATRPRDGVGRWSLAGLIVLLLAIHFANTLAPPPPSTTAVAWSAQALWFVVAWGYWIDRHRTPSSPEARR